MTDGLLESVVDTYLSTYRDLMASEKIDENSVSLSFPFHFASNHRIEVVVTRTDDSRYVLSDSARIMSELRDSGYHINKDLRARLEQIGKSAGIRMVRDYLVSETDISKLGDDIQRFVEAAKTIGDVYFIHKVRPIAEKEIGDKVKRILNNEGVVYQEKFQLNGEIEAHKFDFYVPPNGIPGLALQILSSQSTHTAAQVWAFKCEDVKRQAAKLRERLRLGIVIDTTQVWSDESKRILESRADVVLPDNNIETLPRLLHLG